MAKQRKRYTAEFKAKVALEAVKGQKTIQELASQFGLHPNQISDWKKEVTDRVSELFGRKMAKPEADAHSATELYEQIGRLQVEVAWLKKTLNR